MAVPLRRWMLRARCWGSDKRAGATLRETAKDIRGSDARSRVPRVAET
jgi:hypothetical protein